MAYFWRWLGGVVWLGLLLSAACQAETPTAPSLQQPGTPTAAPVAAASAIHTVAPTATPSPATSTVAPSPTTAAEPTAASTTPTTIMDTAPLVGIYKTDANYLVSIFRNGSGLSYIDYRTGRTGPLTRQSDDVYTGGPSFGVQTPIEVTATFSRDATGNAHALTWAPLAAAPITAIKTERPRQAEVRFQNGDVSLAGTLVLPTAPGPHPALVMIHGSNPVRRTDPYYRGHAEFYAYHGFAVLLYDKRGVGESSGTYVEMAWDRNIDNLAEDALAGVRLLQARSEIDPSRIGLMGASQAGWVGPRAAAKSDAVAFLVMISGPSVSPGQEWVYEGLNEQRTRGLNSLTDAEITQRVLAAGPSIFDPLPYLEKLTIPVLWLYGDLDKSIPVYASIAVLERLKAEQRKDFTIHLLPQANHSLLEARTGYEAEFQSLGRFVPDYFALITAWLKRFG